MAHILSHYGGKTEDRLRHYMAHWIPNHLTWVRSISRSLLQKKGLDIKDYLTYIITKGTPFDEISLLIFCRMYKVHLAVIFKLDFWTTRRDKDIRYCDIVLAYRGNLRFDDTAKLEIVNPLDEVIVSQGDTHIHCKSQTEIQCYVLCTYRQDLQSHHKCDSPKSLGDGLGGYSCTDTIESDYFEGVDESDNLGGIYDDDIEVSHIGTPKLIGVNGK